MSADPRLSRRLVAVVVGATLLAGGAVSAGILSVNAGAPGPAAPPSAGPTAVEPTVEPTAGPTAEPQEQQPQPPADTATSWVGTWATAPTAVPETGVEHLEDVTVRQVVHTSIGGDQVRLRLTNEFGEETLVLGEVHVALRDGADGTDLDPATDRTVTFGGATSVTVPAGAPLVSDPVDLVVPPDADLVVSSYLPEPTAVTTVHHFPFQVNAVAQGNVTAEPSVNRVRELDQWLFLSGVSVAAPAGSAAVVTLGDSITDGAATRVGANHRWPDLLGDRLRDAPRLADRGVLNVGISGNRLLHPNPDADKERESFAAYLGHSGLRRFDRDVLAQPGARYVITLLGVNDIGQAGGRSAPADEAVTAQQLIDGHRQVVARGRTAGLTVYCGTILPFGGTPGYDTPRNEAVRHALNEWIRTSGECDAVIDFDAAVRDPAEPTALRAEYDSGDHLHPNDAGMAAMADAVPLHLFR
ncbi:SGNH/GDSL hydrolase family protein [Promicromonospora sp. NPDC050249]|uniref:SGNH/GDSL hydrolase family protein n=1 Tax=Promicromonospora sp. NPDC050249 TaxID=3154743 RepID=UPI0033F755D0